MYVSESLSKVLVLTGTSLEEQPTHKDERFRGHAASNRSHEQTQRLVEEGTGW